MIHLRTAVVIVALALIIFTIPVLAQQAATRPEIWLSNLYMLDARTGWAQSAEGWSGNFAKGAFGSVVRTYVTLPQGLLIRSLFFINPRDGWLISWNDIYRSTDSGATWSQIGSTELSRHHVRITFLNARTGWISGFSGDGTDGIYQLVTNDGGHSWQRQILSLPAQFTSTGARLEVGAPKFFSPRDGVLTVGYSNGRGSPSEEGGALVYLTHDAGKSWTYTTPLIWKTYVTASGGFVHGFASASFADTNHGWVTDTELLYRTLDSGRTWTKVRPGTPYVDTIELEFISPREGWAPGMGFHPPYLLKTVDGGRTWKDLSFSISRQ